MNKNKECFIVTELLPLYLEQQTGKHSNQYIEEHIKKCDDCRKTMKYMSGFYGKCTIQKEGKNRQSFFEKIKKRILAGYAIVLIMIWVFIIVCFM